MNGKVKGTKWGKWIIAFAAVWMMCALPASVKAAKTTGMFAEGKVYDVTDYGADKTGEKDSQAAVQSALDAARSDIRKGLLGGRKAIIYFPNGNYKLNSKGDNIRLYQDMLLKADKKAIVTLAGKHGVRWYKVNDASVTGGTWIGGSKTEIFSASGVKNLSIEDVTAKSGNVGFGLYQTTAILDNVYAASSRALGAEFTNGSKVTVNNSRFNGHGKHGVAVYNNSTVVFNNSQMNKSKQYGASVIGASATFNNCKIHRNGRHAIDTGNGMVTKVTLKKCDIYHNGVEQGHDSILLNTGTIAKITDCTFRSNAVSAIHLNGGRVSATIKNCTFKGNEWHDIYLENYTTAKSSMSISGCKFYEMQKRGTEAVRVKVEHKKSYSMKLSSNNKFYGKKNLKYAILIDDVCVDKK